jgi:hypothetical protein
MTTHCVDSHGIASGRAAWAAPVLVAFAFASPAAFAQSMSGGVMPPVSGAMVPAASGGSVPAAGSTSRYGGVNPATSEIRDIRGPKPLTSPWLPALVGLAALVAAGGGYALWARNRRPRRTNPRPADIALERLEHARALMQPAQGRAFSIEVSAAVREYVESRFGLKAAHLTTDEFLHQVLEPAVLEPVDSAVSAHRPLLAAHRPLLQHFLQSCDLAKFGGWNLAVVDMEAMLQGARRFIVDSAVDQLPPSASRETYVSLSAA